MSDTECSPNETEHEMLLDTLAALAIEQGGFTVREVRNDTPGFGDDALYSHFVKVTEGIAVADPKLSISVEFPSRATLESRKSIVSRVTRAFVNGARAHLTNGRVVGGWIDTSTDTLWLDVVDLFTNRDEAIEAGRDRDQIAIFDIGTGEEIPTGGTGGLS